MRKTLKELLEERKIYRGFFSVGF